MSNLVFDFDSIYSWEEKKILIMESFVSISQEHILSKFECEVSTGNFRL